MAKSRAQTRPTAARSKAKTLEDNVGVRIMRLSEVFSRLSKQLVEERWGLRATELRVLNYLDGKDSVPLNELARRIHVDKAWISRTVRQMEARGLVARRTDPDDARISSVALTDRGRGLYEEIREPARTGERQLLKGIDEQAFKSQLDRLLANAEAILDET